MTDQAPWKTASRVASIVCLVAATLGPSLPVWGLELSGVWKGKVRCKAFDGVRRAVPARGATLTVRQAGRHFTAQLEDSQGLRHYNGEVVRQAGRDRRIEAVMMECRSSSDLNDYSEAVNFRGTLFEKGGRLSGESIFRTQLGEIGTCRWRFDRSSASIPTLSFCP